MQGMTVSVVRVLVLLGIMVLLASTVCLIYPLMRARSPRLGLVARAIAFSTIVGTPLAVLGAYLFAPLRPLVDTPATNSLGMFPAGQGLASFFVGVLNIQYEVTPNLWTGLGIGAGFGVAVALATRGMVTAAVAAGKREGGDDEDNDEESLNVAMALGWSALLALGAIALPVVAVAAGNSLTPSSFVQLAPGDELVAGLIFGVAGGFLIATGAAAIVDLMGALLARWSPRSRREPSGDPTERRHLALAFGFAAAAPVLLFLGTCWVIVMLEVVAGDIHQQDWATLILHLLFSPVILVVLIWPGLISGLASGLRAALGESVARTTKPSAFDAYTLLGGVLFGLILAGGSNVPLLGWVLGFIGTLGWAGVLVGLVLGGLLAGLPFIMRRLMALPDVAWVVMGCALLSVGGVLVLTPAWLS